jgi:hypothetical protein
MRVGFNPNKDKILDPNVFFHQVVVPVYIPNQEGYFKDSFQILQFCLESLFKTCHSKTYFTIVNNGCCVVVVEYLNSLQQQLKIQEVIHTTPIGKLNAILKGLMGHNFDMVTITDADVLFLNNWQKGTYDIFEAFPKAGAVSPVPSSKVLKQFTGNVIFENLFSSKLKFTATKDKESLQMFAKSIGNTDFYNKVQLNKNLTISTDIIAAIVGAGHFVATYRGSIFETMKKHSKFKMGSSLKFFLDKPVEDKGYWRLSTTENHAYHMGNVFEEWMNETSSTIEENTKEIKSPNNLLSKPNSYLRPFVKFSFKIISQKVIWKLFLRSKGLTKEEANEY